MIRLIWLAIKLREWFWNIPKYATRIGKVTQKDIEWAKGVSDGNQE